jgi:hypothetical protein
MANSCPIHRARWPPACGPRSQRARAAHAMPTAVLGIIVPAAGSRNTRTRGTMWNAHPASARPAIHRATMLAVEARRVEPRDTFPVSGASTGVEKTCGERAKVMRGRTFRSKIAGACSPGDAEVREVLFRASRLCVGRTLKHPEHRDRRHRDPSAALAATSTGTGPWRASVKPFVSACTEHAKKGRAPRPARLLKSRCAPARGIAVARRADRQRRHPCENLPLATTPKRGTEPL